MENWVPWIVFWHWWALAAVLLHEPVSASMLAVTTGVILCVAGARKFAS